MSESTAYVRSTRAKVQQSLAALPRAARSGSRAADAIMTRIGLTVLGHIKQAFIAKARGGADEAGDSWVPLSPKTIAYSKTRQRGRGGRTRSERARPAHPSQALDTAQRERWWQVYRQQVAIYRGGRGSLLSYTPQSAKAHAAAVAWIVLKREGAQTILDKYGHRRVEILRDTGLLLNSLSPGVASPHKVFRVGPGEVIIGTNRKGAAAHHAGAPSRNLPQRRLWPPPSRWPHSWWRDVLDQAKQGLLDLASKIIKR